MISRITVRGNNLLRLLSRCYSEGGPTQRHGSASSSAPPPSSTKDVPGLSTACIEPANEPVGPGVDPKKTGPYKSPEYFQYNAMTYFEAEVEMAKYRIPQPSALKPANS